MIKLFVDFDGTITRSNVGEEFFLHFGGKECGQLVEDYESEAISCMVSRDALNAFIDRKEMDPSFPGFVEYCRGQSIELTILSDGTDYSISRILDRYGIAGIPVYANKLCLEEVNGSDDVLLRPTFPFDNEECAHCACCKRNIILTKSGDDDIIVYVGDGYSDYCPAQYADIVFAKDRLQAFCQRENITYHEYRTFGDVKSKLEHLRSQNRLRKRRAAEHRRQQLYAGG